MKKINNNKGYKYAFGSASIFGIMPLLTRLLYQRGLDAISCGFYRMFLMLGVMLIFNYFVKKDDLRLTLGDAKRYFILAVFFSATSIMLFTSYNYIESGVATSIHFIFPVITFVINSIVNKTKPALTDKICIFATMMAILIIMDYDKMDNLTGVLVAALSALAFSLYGVVMEHIKFDKNTSLKMLFYVNLFSSVIICFYSKGVGIGIQYQNLDIKTWTMALAYSFFLTIGGTFLFQQSVKSIGATYTSMVSTSEVALSIILGFLFLNENLTLKQVLAILLIIFSSIVLIKSKVKLSQN